MNYLLKSNETTTVRISSFGEKESMCEYQVIITINNPKLPFQDQLLAVLDALNRTRQECGAQTIFKRYFLSDASNQYDELLNYELDASTCPLSVIGQAPLNGTKIALWATMMTGVQTHSLNSGLFEVKQGRYRHLFLASAHNEAKDSEHQTRILLNDYAMQLLKEGCTLKDNCIRTWFFVNDIDNHYHGVVKARNEVFATQNLTDQTHFIASTGIGGKSHAPGVLAQMDAYAIDGISPEQVHYLYAADHLNRTSDYGVSFERGSYVDMDDRRHIFISGTASIDNKGHIMHQGDVRKQCERMWENVEALLHEANAGFQDVGEIIVYLRDTADYAVVSELFAEKFPQTPYVIVHAPVCRPGWLIEMECTAITAL